MLNSWSHCDTRVCNEKFWTETLIYYEHTFKSAFFEQYFPKTTPNFQFKTHIAHFYAIHRMLVMLIDLLNRFLGIYRNLMLKIIISWFLWDYVYFQKINCFDWLHFCKNCLKSELIVFSMNPFQKMYIKSQKIRILMFYIKFLYFPKNMCLRFSIKSWVPYMI